MVHVCKVLCSSDDAERLEDLGLQDPGVWADIAIELDHIVAIKRSGANPTDEYYGASTVYTEHGDSYIINVSFPEMLALWTGKDYESPEDEINL
jgi:hypothetical protein